MSKGFLKFKRKLWISAVVRALIVAFSVGIIALATQWLIAKMHAISPDFFLYGLRSTPPAVVGFAVVLLILLPTNRRVARFLDTRLGLGEKVQTMLAFRQDEGDMASIQRADTDRILCETPRKKVKRACTWLFVLIPSVAVLCMAGTLLVPAGEPAAPPSAPDPTFSMTPWQEQSLKDLIEQVKTSDMEASPKENVVKQLESLLIKLKSVRKESVMKETVIGTIESIHETVSEHNTYDLLASALFGSSMPSVRELGTAVSSLEALLVGEWIQDTYQALVEDGSDAAALATDIRRAAASSGVSPSDPIRQSLEILSQDLATVTGSTEDDTVHALLLENELLLNSVLYAQAVNEAVEDDTVYSLLSIFGIKASEVPEHVFNDPEDPRGEGDYRPEDDMDKIHAGGIGTGELIFGSDDTVYDPDTGTYVSYGEILNRYYARVTELLVDGRLTPEMERAVSDYFAILFDGSANKESDRSE